VAEVIDRRIAFNGGEWSPWTDPRLDLEKYRNSCRVMRNFRPTVYGGAFRRQGTFYLGAAYSHTKKSRLVEFEFNIDTKLVLEFADLKIRFWTTGDTAGLIGGGTPVTVTTPWTEDELFDLQFAHQNDVIVITHPDRRPRVLTRTSTDSTTWTLAELAMEWPVVFDENLTSTTLTASAVTGGAITLTASAATFVAGHVGSRWIITHRRENPEVEIRPKTATVTDVTSALYVLDDWTASIAAASTGSGSTWEATLLVERSYDKSTWETLRTLNSSRAQVQSIISGTELEPCWLRLRYIDATDQSDMPGNLRATVTANNPDHFGLVEITGYTSSTVVTASVLFELGATTATKKWSEAAWSDYRGWPRAVTFHEQRLMFGGTSSRPQTIWGSVIDDYYNFRVGSDDDMGLALTLVAEASNSVQWMASIQTLLAGTSTSEWAIGNRDAAKTLTPGSAAAKRQSGFGSSHVQARVIQDAAVFVQRSGRKIREFAYTYERDGYSAQDLAMLAEHLPVGITSMAVQTNPDTTIWVATSTGQLLGLVYERQQNVAGWFRYDTGEDDFFESVAVIAGEGADDEIWVSVKRTIDGATKRYIERFQVDTVQLLKDLDQDELCYVDSALRLVPSGTTVSGLDHLEGMEVSVLADGSPHPNRTVLDGEIELQYEADLAIVGLPYVSEFSPTWLETNDPASTTKAMKKRPHRVVMELWRTLGAEVSGNETTWDAVEFRTPDGYMDAAPPLFDGITTDQGVDAESDRQIAISLRQTQPLPLNVLSLSTRYTVSDI
jgi:hypothetical protein